MGKSTSQTPHVKRGFFVSLQEESLERKLTLAFGFMSFIPILIVLTMSHFKHVDMSLAIYLIVGSVFIGYFVVARPMIRSVIRITSKVSAISEGRPSGMIEVGEHNEIGELARTFNRITRELEQKIDELESSRELIKRLLARIGTAIGSYEGIDNLLNLIVENTATALEAQMGSLLVVDGEKQEISIKTAWSENGRVRDANMRIKLGDGVAGRVVKEGNSVRGRATAKALGFIDEGKSREGAILCVPLRLRDQPMGVLGVMRQDPAQAFSEDDESLVASIGAQMAVAIENYRLNLDVERTYVETIMALAIAVEAKDPYSAGHSKRVGHYSMKIGEVIGLDEEMCRTLKDAGILHDIGKIGIKDEILLKPTVLTSEEEKVMQQHPIIGEAIVKPVHSLRRVVEMVRHHHEEYDGTGYPAALKGQAIPLGARIIAVADTYDSIITDRPYRKRLSIEAAKAELKKQAGAQFDPSVVEAFLKVLSHKEKHKAAKKRLPSA